MKVKITILPVMNSDQDVVEYVASCPEDCADATDRSVYDLVMRFGETIKMGCVIGEAVDFYDGRPTLTYGDRMRSRLSDWGDRWPGD